MPEPLAIWNPARDAWETPQVAICGHSAVFSGTWPVSGTTRAGKVYPRPPWVPPTADTGFSLLPTPNAFHLKNTETPEEWAARRAEVKSRTKTNLGMPLPVAVQLLPTPTVQDGENTAGPSQHKRHVLPLNTAVTYLGRRDGLDPPGEQLLIPMPGDTDWGPYTAAIERWEQVLGRPAPEPMVDGVLSARFIEWVMGLPGGWVTGVPGVARTTVLRMLGNGVVPAQAAAAMVHLGIREWFP